jgi:methyl-accepting chemotaxis protein
MASTSPPTSSEPVAAAVVRRLRAFARALAIGGGVVLALILTLDPRWLDQWVLLLGLAVATGALRIAPVRLSKFSYLTQTGLPGLVGVLVAAPSTALLAVAAGTAVSDGLVLRKPLGATLVNAGRELLALAAAAGFFYLAAGWAGSTRLSLEHLPAAVVLLAGYFVASRALFYYSLLVRDKLPPRERLFILRWEVLTYLITAMAVAVVVWALHSLAPAGWLATLSALGVVGVLARTIIEEAIAAEDLARVHLTQAAITGNVSLQTALEQIEQDAHRLVDWDDLRIYRWTGNEPVLLYRSRIGRPGRDGPDPAIGALRETVVREGRGVTLGDARTEAGVASTDPPVCSVAIHPLKFSEQTIGTLEVEHRKPRFYRVRDLNALTAIGNQVATAIHIAELRRPLLETVEEIGGQVRSLVRAADSLRGSARALAAASESLRLRAGQQEEFARHGMEATAALADAAAATAMRGARAAGVSRETVAAAARHRDAIGEAIRRLVEVQGVVAGSAEHVGALGQAAGRMGSLITGIREVAELTKLIALNATLEAERAGGQGRVFTVVAEEIQRLAFQTDQTARDASGLADEIGGEVKGVLGRMSEGQQLVAGVGTVSADAARALEAIVEAARESGEQANSIAASAAEGESAAQALAEQLRHLADASRQTRGDVSLLANQASAAARGQAELEEAIHHLERVAADLQRVARHFVVGG